MFTALLVTVATLVVLVLAVETRERPGRRYRRVCAQLRTRSVPDQRRDALVQLANRLEAHHRVERLTGRPAITTGSGRPLDITSMNKIGGR